MASQRKKTIIVDGEIYAGEDDPRYQEMLRRRAQASQAQAAPAAAAPAPGAGAHHAQGGAPRRAPQQGGGGFDFSKPPLRFVDPLPGTALMQGIPDLEVFGMRITAYVLLGVTFLTWQFGWRALAGVAVLYYIYQANQGVGAAPPPPRPRAAGPGGAPQGHQQAPQQQQPQQQQGGGIADMFGGLGLGGGSGGAAGGSQGHDEGAGDKPAGGPGGASPGGAAFQGRGHRLGGN